MRVINTDNHGGDYPNEKFVSESLTFTEARKLADKLNEGVNDWSDRWHMVVEDDYTLQPGFEP
jgi:peroxiredoxin